MRRVLLLLCTLVVLGCATMEEGAPVNLEAIATPDLVKASAPPPVVPPRPLSSSPMLRVWIPRQVSPNGDAVAGHFLEVSPQALPQEVVPPSKVIPRAPARPARIVQPKPVREAPPPAQDLAPEFVPSSPPPPAALPPVAPTFPLPGESTYGIRP